MTNILTKIIKANQEYEILGGGSSSAGEEHEVITQAAYNALTPAQKAEKVYMIKENGTPSTVLTAGDGIDITNNVISADMSTAVYDNSSSGATATNVQGAIDEVFQSVSNGKELIADAITDKGVSTSATDSFATMASNIESIDTNDDYKYIATHTTGSIVKILTRNGLYGNCGFSKGGISKYRVCLGVITDQNGWAYAIDDDGTIIGGSIVISSPSYEATSFRYFDEGTNVYICHNNSNRDVCFTYNKTTDTITIGGGPYSGTSITPTTTPNKFDFNAHVVKESPNDYDEVIIMVTSS